MQHDNALLLRQETKKKEKKIVFSESWYNNN